MTEDFPKLYVYSYVEDQARLYGHTAEIEPTLEALEAYYNERVSDIYGDDDDDDDDDDDEYDYLGPVVVKLSFDKDLKMSKTAICRGCLEETLQGIKDLYAITMLFDELHIKYQHTNYGWFHIRIGGATKELRFSNRDKIVVGDPMWSARIFLRTTFDTLRKDLINFMAQ